MGDVCSKSVEDQQKNNNQKLQRPSTMEQSVAISYENGSFNLPTQMPFQKQSTYIKIQKAAYNFCQQNMIDLDFIPCITRIIAYRQQKIFLASFKKISESEKQSFMQEVNRIPQDQIDLFYHNFINETKRKYSISSNKTQKNAKLSIPKYTDATNLIAGEKNRLQEIGNNMIQNSQLALVIMCAGSSSRFDNQDKFLVPLNLKTNPNLTMLDLIFMRVKSLLGKKQIPIIITCNEINFKPIQNFIREREHFGFQKFNLRFMQIQCLPVLDLNGKYCINQKFKLMKRPFGTGRTVTEILKQRNLNWLKQEGVKYMHFIGAQNLMQAPCDPLMLGQMKQKSKKVCAKCVGTSSQWEKLPRYVATKQNKIYLKFWNELNSMTQSALYSAYKLPIATNSMMIELSYLQQLIKDFHTDMYLSQNYHILRRKQKILNPYNNNKPVTTECLTFQGDLRDILTCCQDPELLFVQRSKNYAPIFSKKEQYSLTESVQFYEQHLTQQYLHTKSIHQFVKSKSQN